MARVARLPQVHHTTESGPFILRDMIPPREFRRAQLKRMLVDTHRNTDNEIGLTEQHSIKKSTMEMYERMMESFKRTAKINPAACTPQQLDKALVKHFDQLYLEGEAPHAGERLWAAVRFLMPAYSSQGRIPLPRAWRSLRGWRRLVPQKNRRPLPWIAIAFIARHLALKGGVGMALAWLTMVDAYLRPGECLGLHASQVLPSTQQKHMRSVALLLHPDQIGIAPKVGEMSASLLIRRPWLGPS